MPSECITPIYLEPVEAMAELSHTPPHLTVGQNKVENTPGHRPVVGATSAVPGIDQGPGVQLTVPHIRAGLARGNVKVRADHLHMGSVTHIP